MKLIFKLFIILSILIGCKKKEKEIKTEKKINNLEILIDSISSEITLNGRKIQFKDTLTRKNISIGKHLLKTKQKEYKFELVDNEKIVINLSKNFIVMEELLYSEDFSIFDNAKAEDYKTPFNIISLNGLKYFGPYKMIDSKILSGWDFGLDDYFPKSISTQPKTLQKNEHIRKYKIYTISEFKNKKKALNDSNEWIQLQTNKNASKINKDYVLIVEQLNYLVIKSNKIDYSCSVGQVKINTQNNIEVRNPNLYDREKHGKITSQIATIKNCVFKGTKKNKLSKIAIVMSKKSHQPHIKILN